MKPLKFFDTSAPENIATACTWVYLLTWYLGGIEVAMLLTGTLCGAVDAGIFLLHAIIVLALSLVNYAVFGALASIVISLARIARRP